MCITGSPTVSHQLTLYPAGGPTRGCLSDMIELVKKMTEH
jgi:hypothetical protein